MKETAFTNELGKIDIVRNNYMQLLKGNECIGNEIIPVYGFLKDALIKYIEVSKNLSDDHKKRLNTIKEDDDLNVGEVKTTCINQTDQRKRLACARFQQETEERDKKIDAANKSLAERIEKAESERNMNLRELKEEEDEILRTYRSVKIPKNHKFFIKSNKKEYDEKYLECSNLYNTLRQEIDSKKAELEKKAAVQIEEWKSENLKTIQGYRADFETFDKAENSGMDEDLRKLEREKQRKLELLERERVQNIEKENQLYMAQTARKREKILEVCRSFLTDQNLLERIRNEKDNRFDFYSFHAVKRMPAYIDQGYFSCRLGEDITGKVPEDILSAIWEWVGEFNCSKEHFVIKLPNVQKADLGIDYFLAMNTKENVGYIRTLVFSILMQYPAGKMNLVMIDPRTSTSFAGLVKLGEDDKAIIDTKVWNTDADIQSAVSRFNDKLNEIVNRYGSAINKCLEKENHNLMAIADFPQGFSAKALRDLAIILENGPKYGVNFVIAQNDEEMEAKKNSPEYWDLIERIRKRMRVFTRKDGAVCYGSVYGGREYVREQTMDSRAILDHDIDIINEIYEHLSDNIAEIITQKDVHNDLLTDEDWLCESSKEGISLPVGIKGIDDKLRLILGRTNSSNKRHHVLIEGTTGAGKSVLLHAIISSALMKYSPQELQIVLLDYKEGVEFKVYADYDLPGIRIVSTESEREFGRNVFKLMAEEHEARSMLFKNEMPDVTVPNIHDYREKTKKSLPLILFIIDEFETLLGGRNDEISQDILENLSLLVKQGRSSGIHMILSSQNMNLPENISSQMAIRFALNGSKHVLAANNNGVELLKANQAIFNDDCGSRDRNTIFQVMYTVDNLRDTLKKISELEAEEDYEPYMHLPKKILYANIEDYTRHPFNNLILKHLPPVSLTGKDGDYAVTVGESYDFYDPLLVRFTKAPRNNLLVVTKEDSIGIRLGVSVSLSLLYSDCANKDWEKRQMMTILDFGADKLLGYNKEDIRELLADRMKGSMTYLTKKSAAEEAVPFKGMHYAIDKLYKEYCLRKSGYISKMPMFLIVYGLERTHILSKGSSTYEDDIDREELSAIEKLKSIIKDGALVGIHIIAFVKDYVLARNTYGSGFEEMFRHRIVSKAEDELFISLVSESDGTKLNSSSAIYYDSHGDIKKQFRVLELPKALWVQKFCAALKNEI